MHVSLQRGHRSFFGALLVIGSIAGCSSSDDTGTPVGSQQASLPSTVLSTDAAAATATSQPAISEPATSAPAISEPAISEPTSGGAVASPSTSAAAIVSDRPLTLEAAFALDRPLNIPHAGGDLEAPHSTMFAFKAGVTAGADVLELDIRRSADGVLVVHHDDTVDRTANGTGLVSDLTLAELKAFDNAFWFVPGCWSCKERSPAESPYRGVRTGDVTPPTGSTADDFAIATLDEVLAAFPAMLFDIEIKGEGAQGEATARALADRLVGSPDGARVVVASFSDDLLTIFKAAAPDVVTSPGLGAATEFVLNGVVPVGHRVLQVPPTFNGLEVVSPALIDKVRAANMELWVWPESSETDDSPLYRELIDLGVDGVIAGRPTAMAALIKSEP